ncbi:MAG: TolC family protein [Melioribacteraceae bacterium]|jgi:outer membrane protein|nr:TolC family protein [Melioribacteraceae bacterium]
MKKLLILLVVMMMTTVSFSQTTLTLDEAIKIALQRNSALVKAKYNLESSAASVKSAYGDLLPNLGIRSGWSWSKIDDIGGSQLDYLGNSINVPATSIDTRNYSVGAGGSVVLFNGLANLANISSAEMDQEAAELNIDKFKRDIVQATTIFYYSILRSKALAKVKEENFKYNNKLLETITERNRLGSAPVADLYAQQVQTGNAEVDLIRANYNVSVAQNNLIDYLSLDVLKEYEFVSSIVIVDNSNIDSYGKEFSSVKEMVEYALENRTDYLGQQRTVSSSEKGITIAKGGFWPSLTGGYNFSTNSVAVDNLFDRRVWGVSLNLNIPIFSNFNTETSVQYAKVRNLSAQEDLSALERQVKIEIKQGYLDFDAVSKALEVAIKTVKSATENRRVQYERYSLGSGTFLDVLQSDRDYQTSISLKIDAEFNFHSSKEALLNSIGKLNYAKYENESGNK